MGAVDSIDPALGPRPPGRDLVGAELGEFAGALAQAPELWRDLVRHTPDERIYELVWADEHVNAWVICWSAGHDTGFHDHGCSAGAIHVVQGIVCEERLSVGRIAGGPAVGEQGYGPGMSLCVPASAIHRVFHGGTGPAVSLHAYSPPLTQMGDYRLASDGRLEREPRSCTPPPAGAPGPSGRSGLSSRRRAAAVRA